MELYEKELDSYYNLDKEDKSMVDLMRTSRIDLQLRMTRKVWKEEEPVVEEIPEVKEENNI
eukprot:CAMPEP_0116899524 /NCGR_PEP_ID=MMETSP0467-20121206/8073_1 /TAXON_ID=283647 /ORGANISM="Mesodinium pulex, Strain SPMC105" /LENGTH=60 /DNA_ID=CAMNT_0004572391 /DNA_START=1020 /DNA_END=1199 /DNA_ORIENTATION=-